jgi:hypothetical protein
MAGFLAMVPDFHPRLVRLDERDSNRVPGKPICPFKIF